MSGSIDLPLGFGECVSHEGADTTDEEGADDEDDADSDDGVLVVAHAFIVIP